ncbi:MAG: hypothetical protein KC476_04960, partial [Cyanobacteria bacterium HKST-UBA06]|nr:hypothetical protein [Cyanobacteria bacterium HKST-UBA06]
MTYQNTHTLHATKGEKPKATGYLAPPWASTLDEGWLRFYIKPLLRKWAKDHPQSTFLLISETAPQAVEQNDWHRWQGITTKQTRFEWASTADLPLITTSHHEPVDGLILVHSDPTPELLTCLCQQRLAEGGVLVVVCPNQWAKNPLWQAYFNEPTFAKPFQMGFHPNGALAFWPL